MPSRSVYGRPQFRTVMVPDGLPRASATVLYKAEFMTLMKVGRACNEVVLCSTVYSTTSAGEGASGDTVARLSALNTYAPYMLSR
jgi:hypothetical protein